MVSNDLVDNFIPMSSPGMERCQRCRKWLGLCTCEVYPKWIPDKALDEECPHFEKMVSNTLGDKFILMSSPGAKRCKKCKKLRGLFNCEKHPWWIPNKALDEECPDFEEKETDEEG